MISHPAVPTLLRVNRLLLGAAVAATLVACEGEPVAPEFTTADIILAVTTIDGSISARYVDEFAPHASGGPAVTGTLPAAVISGAAAPIVLRSETPFSHAIINIAGVQGHYVIDFPTPVTEARLVAQLAPELPLRRFVTTAAVASSPGVFGPFAERLTRAISVGTGDVQVSVAWDAHSDVDLHVVTPAGEHIFFGNREGDSGELDLDSNAACNLDRINNENIVFPTGTAPQGTYTAYVHLWSACETSETNYVLAVQRRGHPVLFELGTLNEAQRQGPDLVFDF